MGLKLDFPVLNNLTDAQRNFDRLQTVINKAAVTALPAGYDGEEIEYVADSANGVVWKFKYRSGSASSFKWEFVGGGELYAEQMGAFSTALTTFQTPGDGPSITLPLAGDYMVTVGAYVFKSTVTDEIGLAAYSIAGAAASDDDAMAGIGGSNKAVSAEKTRRKNGVTAGSTCAYRARSSLGATVDFYRRTIRAQPVRVG